MKQEVEKLVRLELHLPYSHCSECKNSFSLKKYRASFPGVQKTKAEVWGVLTLSGIQ